MTTPTLGSVIRSQNEERERQIQTSFPAKVVSYSAADGTVTVEPQFFEVWREGGERVVGKSDTLEENYLQHVPVLFPRSGAFSITFPIADNSFGLVTCTKYSLDVWREAGTAGDPGDLRRFTMSGAIFHPVNLFPETAKLVATPSTSYMVLSETPGNAQFVALANLVNAELGKIKTELEGHEHTATWTDPAGSGPTSANTASYSKSDVDSAKVKVE